MKKRVLARTLFVSILIIAFTVSSAWAGKKQRHRWEGVAIGVGAALIGSALLGHHDYAYASPTVEHNYYYPPPRYRPSGHYETRRVWIDPCYERVWNPGHYNRRYRWISGHWIEIEKSPGYWGEEQVWVNY